MSKKARTLILTVGALVVIGALVLAVTWLRSNVFGTGESAGTGTTAASSAAGAGEGNASATATPMSPLLKSSVDRNNNGVDDYTDLVAGAREVAKEHPTYDDGYYQGGYPPSGKGASPTSWPPPSKTQVMTSKQWLMRISLRIPPAIPMFPGLTPTSIIDEPARSTSFSNSMPSRSRQM